MKIQDSKHATTYTAIKSIIGAMSSDARKEVAFESLADKRINPAFYIITSDRLLMQCAIILFSRIDNRKFEDKIVDAIKRDFAR